MTKKTRHEDFNDSHRDDSNGINLLRRSLIKIASVGACTRLVGIGASSTGDADEFDIKFADRRVQEARKAWVKGFRGRPDRTLGVLSDSLESRHPDIGPWNGIRAVPDGDDGLELVKENLEVLDDVPDDIRFLAEDKPIPTTTGDRHDYPFTGPQDVDQMVAHAKGPAAQSNGLKLLLETDGGVVIESNAETESPHTGIAARIEPGKDYVLAIENTMRSIRGDYFLEALYYTDNPDGETDPFADVNPDNITADTPKTLGWYNEDYNTSNPHPEPWSGPHYGGQGQYLASIMAGSGRASAIDPMTITKDNPNEVLLAGDQLVYEVQAEPDRGVFGVAYGENVQVVIVGPDGTQLESDHEQTTLNRTSSIDSAVTVHDVGTETYEVQIRSTRRLSNEVSNAPGRVRQVCVGAFKPPNVTAGDRTDEEENPTMFAGIAPNSGIIGLSGWRKTRKDLRHFADDFADMLNLRVLVISLGFGNDIGIAGGIQSDGSIESYKALADAGILTVCRSPSHQPPAFKDRAPAGADESIHVVNAGPWDGIRAKDSNEPLAIDEDGEGVYRKPDVTARGSGLGADPRELVIGAANADAWRTEEEQGPIRKYKGWANFSAQTPFVAGMAGIVAQALEEKAPAGIALPAPKNTNFADTMRLKHTILATASETPFTASPWHDKEPTYDFGGHDPIEGWGRVNIDAAVDAASRDFTPPNARARDSQQGRAPAETKTMETVGLNLPHDSRAVAGHIAGEPGIYEVSINFEHFTGEDQLQEGVLPHIDLFVYDAKNPGQHGTPNIVAKAQGLTGSASVQFTAESSTDSNEKDETYYAVAKLVNIPGAFNSFDIQANFSLSVAQIESLSETETVRNGDGGG